MSTEAFQTMRFNILVAALSPATRDKIPDDYAFEAELATGPDPQLIRLLQQDFRHTGSDRPKTNQCDVQRCIRHFFAATA